ncbi:hypothetical protein B0H66DRAFT_540269 [Apodospora peruviana]|uniref:Glutathione S-transferase n=1 Tax=Apodospora peruviana TaxID=516989 RepID=A0AAE0ME10_9PEZI|nr:hypothetical protein B0H66DRAFT_540269 [Apodospora peruviana]
MAETEQQQQQQQNKEQSPFLTVYSFDRDEKKYSLTQFVTKLQFRLRYAGIPYVNGFGSRQQAPKAKMPYVRIMEGDSAGELAGDSALICERLVAMGKMEDVNKDLLPEERATDLCLRAMVEDRMYYLTLYERWYDNYDSFRDQGPFVGIPGGIRHVVCSLAYQYAKLILYFQGTGRYTSDEVEGFKAQAMGALADFAEAARKKRSNGSSDGTVKKPFWILGGEKPTEADFTLFGYLSGMLVTPTQPATTALIKSHPSLVDYIARIHRTYFSDLQGLV